MNYPGGVPQPYVPHGQFHDGTSQPVAAHDGTVHRPFTGYTQTPYGAPPAYGPGAPHNWNAGPPPTYAGWAARVGATLLDGAMISIPAAVLVALTFTVGVESRSCGLQQQLDGSFQPIDCGRGLSGVGVALLALTLLLVIGAGLFLVYREGATGQTPGKKALGIQLVRESTGQPLGFGAALGRRLCHVVDSAICYLGYLWPLWDGKKQTFADKIVGSVVVRRS